MARVSEAALEAALTQLSQHVRRTQDSNWTQAFLAGSRMKAANYDSTTRGADKAVTDLFVLVPSVKNGTINPFINLQSTRRWSSNNEPGRSTVWNKTTRGYKQTLLFNDAGAGTERHIQNGIRPDALDVLLGQFQDLSVTPPPREALAVLITRDADWQNEPSTDELLDAAASLLGLSPDDFGRLTSQQPLGTPLLGDPEWSPQLLERWAYGPPAEDQPGATVVQGHTYQEAPIEQITGLVDEFKAFATAYGIAVSDADIQDLLAAILSSQLIVMAGPSGSGKSLMASALSAFFAKKDHRARLEGSRFLARQEEFLGYYSHLAGQQFIAQPPLLDLLPLEASDDRNDVPIVTIEEANLSPIEGYLSALVHGLGGNESAELEFRLHAVDKRLATQAEDAEIPARLRLAPYPRFFATINVDADSPAPARKVASRACVVLTETPSIDEALASADILTQPSIDEADGPASAILGRPSVAFSRYSTSGSNDYEIALSTRGKELSTVLGTEVISFRAYQKSLFYIAWFVELAGEGAPDEGSDVLATAVDNALLHFILPTLPAQQFAKAVEGLENVDPSSVLTRRLDRLRAAVEGQHFGPAPDFWGALS